MLAHRRRRTCGDSARVSTVSLIHTPVLTSLVPVTARVLAGLHIVQDVCCSFADEDSGAPVKRGVSGRYRRSEQGG